MEVFYAKLAKRLHRLVKRDSSDSTELNPRLKELQFRPESDELRIKVSEIIQQAEDNDEYFFSSETIGRLKEVIGIRGDSTFREKPDCVDINEDGIYYSWDLDPSYTIIPNELVRKHTKEVQHNNNSWFTSSPPTFYNTRFLMDSYMVHLQYKGYGGGYSHGDDLWVSVLFTGNQTLDALLLGSIAKKIETHDKVKFI